MAPDLELEGLVEPAELEQQRRPLRSCCRKAAVGLVLASALLLVAGGITHWASDTKRSAASSPEDSKQILREFSEFVAAGGANDNVTRVLFIGNSFTFRNELPAQLEHIAASLGRKVEWSMSALGGCSLYGQTGFRNAMTAQLMMQDWDFIVLQDYSALTAFSATRDKYFYPAIREVIAQKKRAKVVLYMTWAYADGLQNACLPEASFKTKLLGCWPLGDLHESLQAECLRDNQSTTVASFPCMGYALARGYTSALSLTEADLVSPAGLAWQVVKGIKSIPSDCKAAIDQQFPGVTMDMAFPPILNVTDFPPLDLNIWDLTLWDKHASIVGQYLNALTMYATLFGESPVGAAPPVCSELCFLTNYTHTGPGPLTPPLADATVLKLQHAAAGVVEWCGADCKRRSPWIR
eukprot:TRINITY_DN88228_c0_g1_i1.p1 TRINITY_DN88228_c0_g1~~TRINITY_DN88228_c0_g1_i1.p1  ORF type:complete len:426 (-),score=54.94 TRINITY_DN88228_c0_g1_i1:4-1227(-)